jgi:hypothetical protein
MRNAAASKMARRLELSFSEWCTAGQNGFKEAGISFIYMLLLCRFNLHV